MSAQRPRLLLFMCACWLGVGCASNGPPPAGTTSSFDTIQASIFNVHCLSAGCHDSSDRQGDLILSAGASYANLINVAPFNAAARARGLLRVVPGDPDHSFLLIKLTGPPSDEGSGMPLVPPLLSAADIMLVREWILAGAPGSSLPTAVPTSKAAPTSTPSPLDTATPTPAPTRSGTSTITPTGTLPSTPTPTPTQPPTGTATATASPSAIPTPTFSLASTLPQIQATIFDTTCTAVGCHGTSFPQASLTLVAGLSYASLVNVLPVNAAANQAGMRRVDPGRPANSFLITKLTLPAAVDPQFGSRMPSGGSPLTAQQIDNIRAWILRGALADESAPVP